MLISLTKTQAIELKAEIGKLRDLYDNLLKNGTFSHDFPVLFNIYNILKIKLE